MDSKAFIRTMSLPPDFQWPESPLPYRHKRRTYNEYICPTKISVCHHLLQKVIKNIVAQNNNNALLFFIVFVGQDLEKSLTGDVYLGSSMQCSHVLVEPGGPTKGLIGAGASASQEAHSHGW